MMSGCACGDIFRIESCNLLTGATQKIVHPVSASFESILNQVGNGSMVFATKDIKALDIWPGLTQINVVRIAGPNASPDSPVCEWMGYAEKIDMSETNSTTVGLKHMPGYLFRRTIKKDYTPTGVDQNLVSATLVKQTLGTVGAPASLLYGYTPSTHQITKTYAGQERKVLGEALTQITQLINGNEWYISYNRTLTPAGFYIWQTILNFVDHNGVTRNVTIKSDREASKYSLSVDAASLATHVDAIGSNNGTAAVGGVATSPNTSGNTASAGGPLIVSSDDQSGTYPIFDAAPSDSSVTNPATLQAFADGYLLDYQEPVTNLTMTVPGLDFDPSKAQIGDVITAVAQFGGISFNGKVRVQKLAWNFGPDAAVERTYSFLPVTRAYQAILSQPPASDPCVGC